MRYILLVVFLFCGLHANNIKFVGAVPFGSSSLRLEANSNLIQTKIKVYRKDSKEVYIDIPSRLTFGKKEYKFANKTSITLTQHHTHIVRISIKLTKTTSYEYRVSGKYFYIEIKDMPVSTKATTKKQDSIHQTHSTKTKKEQAQREKKSLEKQKEKIKEKLAHKKKEPTKVEPKKLESKKPEPKKIESKKIESKKDESNHNHDHHDHQAPIKPVYITPLSAQFAKELHSFAHDKPILISKENYKENQKLPPGSRKKVIVIDPGHGGKDCGTFGIDKVCEKVIVLAIGKKLASILDRMGYVVYMTRDSDVFIDLRRRTEMANEIKADLFVSIHANSIPKGKPNTPKGIETYFLSTARTERALAVADIENQGDTATMNYFSKSYFLSTINSQRLVASNKLAIDIQFGALKSVRTKYKDVVDGGVREGPFWVLAGALMPSVLIETGYNSNPIEAPRLINNDYQELLAIGIANGIRSYFAKNP
ncbi:hypothetical protein BKH43_04275 [Helicobacter sp. 13S00401-1]|uniref:N-acetylmuramoyl-L-alanine amidase family protein n=1 Tax=Helicobacter sp. 13S00401-1 TaxID=1905758 RepID=UPI000BD4BCBA|nr:N-acetylmuramoyl-L-alanine amidase [Helicobacter sp. 13S00401-1]PAF50779.1 hypothetical protein BKH43_04275 [Helicobacter sp. 13S00401-1]